MNAAQVGHELGSQLRASLGHGAARLGPGQDLSGLICVYFLAEAAGDASRQRGVQPACDLVPGPAQVAAPLAPDLQHSRVPSSGLTGRHDGERSAATATERASSGSFLFTPPRRPAAAPARPAWAARPALVPGRDQLLGQQMPQLACALHRPGPLRPGRRPGQQPLRLRSRGPHPHLAQRDLIRAQRHRRRHPLCGSTPIITTATTCPFPHIHARREPRRACLIMDRLIIAPVTR